MSLPRPWESTSALSGNGVSAYQNATWSLQHITLTLAAPSNNLITTQFDDGGEGGIPAGHSLAFTTALQGWRRGCGRARGAHSLETLFPECYRPQGRRVWHLYRPLKRMQSAVADSALTMLADLSGVSVLQRRARCPEAAQGFVSSTYASGLQYSSGLNGAAELSSTASHRGTEAPREIMSRFVSTVLKLKHHKTSHALLPIGNNGVTSASLTIVQPGNFASNPFRTSARSLVVINRRKTTPSATGETASPLVASVRTSGTSSADALHSGGGVSTPISSAYHFRNVRSMAARRRWADPFYRHRVLEARRRTLSRKRRVAAALARAEANHDSSPTEASAQLGTNQTGSAHGKLVKQATSKCRRAGPVESITLVDENRARQLIAYAQSNAKRSEKHRQMRADRIHWMNQRLAAGEKQRMRLFDPEFREALQRRRREMALLRHARQGSHGDDRERCVEHESTCPGDAC